MDDHKQGGLPATYQKHEIAIVGASQESALVTTQLLKDEGQWVCRFRYCPHARGLTYHVTFVHATPYKMWKDLTCVY